MEVIYIALGLMALGLILIAAEAFNPGGYLVIPGSVLTIVGIWAYFNPDDLYSWMSPVVAIATAVPVSIITMYGYRFLGSPEPPSTTVTGSLLGKEGVVTVEVTPGNLKGKVKIGSDTWSAEADDVIPEGTRVTVIHAEGVHVKVREI